MYPHNKLQKTNCKKSILNLHETIFHEIFMFLDPHTIFLRLRCVCRTIKTYADSFVQLSGVLMFLGHQKTDLLQIYRLKHNVVFVSIHSIKPCKTKMDHTFGGMFNGKVVAGTFIKSKDGLWAQELSAKKVCVPKKNVY